MFIDTFFFILTGVALFVLRRRRPEAERPVRVLGFPVVPALFVLGETAVLLGAYLGEDTAPQFVGGEFLKAGGVDAEVNIC